MAGGAAVHRAGRFRFGHRVRHSVGDITPCICGSGRSVWVWWRRLDPCGRVRDDYASIGDGHAAGVASRGPRSQQDHRGSRLRGGQTRDVDSGQRDRRAGSGVTLAAPRWVAANGPAPARCEVDGAMAPVDTAATARPINFRVVLPAAWNRRAVQLGGGGMNGVIPDLSRRTLQHRRAVAGPVRLRHLRQRLRPSVRRPARPGRGGPGAGGAAAQDWALNDEAIKNLGYMQMKKTHDAAMVLIERVYGERPALQLLHRHVAGRARGADRGAALPGRLRRHRRQRADRRASRR